MASEPDADEIFAFMDRISRESDVSMMLPLVLSMMSAAARSRSSPENPETGAERRPPRDRVILVDATQRQMMVIEGDSGLESLFQELEGKPGQPPASKASIDAMPSVKIVDGDGGSSECVICLEEFQVGGEAKEMPCKHRFHGGCVEKWLNRHGSCPVCRYVMPVEEEEEEETDKADDDGGEERSADGRVRVSIYVAVSPRTSEDSDQTQEASDDDMES